MNGTRFNNFTRKPGSVLVLCFFLIVLCAGCSTSNPPPRELSYGLTLAPSGIDPHINASSELTIPLRSVYDSLIYRDPQTLQFVPGLARNGPSVRMQKLTHSYCGMT